MKKVNKIIALVLIASMLFATLTGCKTALGGGSRDTTVVLKCGDYKITKDTYDYFYYNYKNDSPELSEAEIYMLCVNAIKRNAALEELANEWNIEFTEEDEKTLDGYVQDAIDTEGSEEIYYQFLEEHHLTGDLFRHLYKLRILEDKLREYAYAEQNGIIKSDDATLNDDIQKNFYAAKQILIVTDEGELESDNKALAENLSEQVKAGANFDELSKNHSDDKSVDTSYVYYFTDGQMLEEFESAVKATPIGEIYPDIVKTSAGYHIIMRVALTQDEIDKRFEELRDCFKARRFNELLQAKANELTIEKTDKFQ